jgi:hypothetical protein
MVLSLFLYSFITDYHSCLQPIVVQLSPVSFTQSLALCGRLQFNDILVSWWYIKQTAARFRGQKTNIVFDDQFNYVQLCDWCCSCDCLVAGRAILCK